MSDEFQKEQHSKRIHQRKVKEQKQVKIAKSHGIEVDSPHRFSKHHAMDCGNPECVMCGNPRKTFGERTIQEKRFNQIDE